MNERLILMRKKLKLSQIALAKLLKCSQPNISDYEKGKISVPISALQIISKTYNINLNWLITGEGSMFMGEDEPCQPNRDKSKKDEVSVEYRQELERKLQETQEELLRLRERVSELREENQELNDEIKERFREIIGLQGKLLGKK